MKTLDKYFNGPHRDSVFERMTSKDYLDQTRMISKASMVISSEDWAAKNDRDAEIRKPQYSWKGLWLDTHKFG